MTASELRDWMNRKYGFNPWPEKLEVSADTYANVCQEVFEYSIQRSDIVVGQGPDYFSIRISIGKSNYGLMYKNVELILKREP